ncbi:MAG: hypothetical protein WC523_00730 [Patescibacteria group bacterium]
MIGIKDEILFKFAALLDKLAIDIPVPPKTEELEVMPPEKSTDLSQTVPVPLEIKEKPISNRDVEPKQGTAEWAAKYHTQEFLRGTKQPYRGWIRQPENQTLVKNTMNELVEKSPEDYFAWDLHRRIELKPWLYPAAKALISKDPMIALMKEIYRFDELTDLNTELWKAVLDKQISRSAHDPESKGDVFLNNIFNKMRHLAGRIAVTDPEFYWLYIEGKPVTTKQFDEEAKRVLKQKQELGKSEPVKLKYKTKL